MFLYLYCGGILHQAQSSCRPCSLIINDQQGFQDLDWAAYDRQFRQKASSTPTVQWGIMEGTLWNLSRTDVDSRPLYSVLKPYSTPFTRKVPYVLNGTNTPLKAALIITAITNMFVIIVSTYPPSLITTLFHTYSTYLFTELDILHDRCSLPGIGPS